MCERERDYKHLTHGSGGHFFFFFFTFAMALKGLIGSSSFAELLAGLGTGAGGLDDGFLGAGTGGALLSDLAIVIE